MSKDSEITPTVVNVQVRLTGDEAERFYRFQRAEKINSIANTGRKLMLERLEQWEGDREQAAV